MKLKDAQHLCDRKSDAFETTTTVLRVARARIPLFLSTERGGFLFEEEEEEEEEDDDDVSKIESIEF